MIKFSHCRNPDALLQPLIIITCLSV